MSVWYQVVYTKGHAALSFWAAGYLVNVWQHILEGSFRVSV